MDRNFDELCERLKKTVYNSYKGRLRIDLLWDDLAPFVSCGADNKIKQKIKQKVKQKLKILDAGGGFGPLSIKLAAAGHTIVLCDISEKMLEEASIKFNEAGLSDNLEIIKLPFQSLPEKYYSSFDMVMSHAVMEWLHDPAESFKCLVKYIKPGGLLSLMFYNLNSLICQNAIKGNFLKIMNEEFAGEPNGLTPSKPLFAADVEKWFKEENIEIISKTGIRIFYDLMFKKTRNQRIYEDVFEVEKKYCRIEPFASMGRYVHLIGLKK